MQFLGCAKPLPLALNQFASPRVLHPHRYVDIWWI